MTPVGLNDVIIISAPSLHPAEQRQQCHHGGTVGPAQTAGNGSETNLQGHQCMKQPGFREGAQDF